MERVMGIEPTLLAWEAAKHNLLAKLHKFNVNYIN